MKKFYALLVLITLLIASCNYVKDKNNSTITIDYEALDTVAFFSPTVFSNITPIYLDTSASMLGSPIYLKIKENKFYLLDNQQMIIFTFNEKGECLNKISRQGRGPGEYTFIKDFNIRNNGNIEILCETRPKIVRYTPSGDFINEEKLQFNAMSFISLYNDDYLFYRDRITDSVYKNNIIIKTDPKLKLITSFLTMPEFLLAGYPQMSFSQIEGENTILCKQTFDNNIYKINSDSLFAAYYMDFGQKAYPPEFLSAKSTADAYKIATNMTAAYVGSSFENEHYLMLYIVEEGLENNMGYLLYNKKTKQSKFQKFNVNNTIISCLGAPLALTSNNEVIFIANPALLGEISEDYPIFASLDKQYLNDDAGYILLKLKIR